MKIVAIVQARMSSTRLPNKVLLDLIGEPMLAHVVARTRRARLVDEVAIATTTDPADDVIAECCASLGCRCFRGSCDDLLDRYYQAARRYEAEAIIRITADCPMIDPDMIDCVAREFLDRQPKVHYATNSAIVRRYPRGLDTEVIRFDALERAWREDGNPAWREHVTPYIYRHPERFNLHAVASDVDYSSFRWTVDTPDDWALVQRIVEHFGHNRFSWEEALAACVEHPEWQAINAHVRQKVH